MAKEFDIYLSRQPIECDVTVFALPVREDMTAEDQLVLGTSLTGCTLRKHIGAQSGMTPTSHIEDTLRICVERASEHIEMDASAEFELRAVPDIRSAPIVLCSHAVETAASVYASSEDALLIGQGQVPAVLDKHIGPSASNVHIGSGEMQTWEQDYEQIGNRAAVEAELREEKHSTIRAERSVSVGTEVRESMVRYRRLDEMDDFSLSAWDEMTLEEIGYIDI